MRHAQDPRNYLGYGSGWPLHQHHLHLSLDWDEGYESRMGGAHEIDPYPSLN